MPSHAERGAQSEVLEQEVEAPAHRARRLQEAAHLRAVRGQAGQLLGDVRPLGEERHLLLEAARVEAHRPLGDQPVDPVAQPPLVRQEGLGDATPQLLAELADRGQSRREVLRERSALPIAHVVQLLHRPLGGARDRALRLVTGGRAGRDEEIGDAGEQREGHRLGRRDLVAQRAQLPIRLATDRSIEGHAVARLALQPQVQLEATALHAPAQELVDLAQQAADLLGRVHPDVERSMVHRPNLDHDPAASEGGLSAPKAGHAPHEGSGGGGLGEVLHGAAETLVDVEARLVADELPGTGDVGERVAHVTDAGSGVGGLDGLPGDLADLVHERVQRDALAARDVHDPSRRLRGGAGREVRLDRVLDVAEVARLLAVAEDRGWASPVERSVR